MPRSAEPPPVSDMRSISAPSLADRKYCTDVRISAISGRIASTQHAADLRVVASSPTSHLIFSASQRGDAQSVGELLGDLLAAAGKRADELRHAVVVDDDRRQVCAEVDDGLDGEMLVGDRAQRAEDERSTRPTLRPAFSTAETAVRTGARGVAISRP